jgi:hypothetical protein
MFIQVKDWFDTNRVAHVNNATYVVRQQISVPVLWLQNHFDTVVMLMLKDVIPAGRILQP